MDSGIDEEIGSTRSRLRALPQLQRLLETAKAAELVAEFSRAAVVEATRRELDEVRRAIRGGQTDGAVASADLLAGVRRRLAEERRPVLRRAINATGIVIHTNLGRAPLAEEAIRAAAEAAAGYSNLELDLASGRRGSRFQGVEALLRELTGAEAALVVNNNAAAVLLVLSALASGGEVPGGEVIVSRGELVEIGGSFRIPDIVGESGARLVEVGTTNKTRAADYERAVSPATRALLKVHQSNYRIVGFTSAAGLAELVALGRRHGLPVVEDLGSGTLVDLRTVGIPYEPTVRDSVAAGADLVTFSGDKLLGGPQAGLVVGRRDLVDRAKAHPLMRALRPDKLTLAALEATLRLHLDPERLMQRLPVLRMLSEGEAALRRRGERLLERLAGIVGLDARLEGGEAYAGGGSLPEVRLPSVLVSARPAGLDVEALSSRLRAHRPAVIGRIVRGRFAMDMRTVADAEIATIGEAFRRVLP